MVWYGIVKSIGAKVGEGVRGRLLVGMGMGCSGVVCTLWSCGKNVGVVARLFLSLGR